MSIPPLEFYTSFFTGQGDAHDAASREGMLIAVHFLAKLDQSWARYHPGLPKLYDAGVTYHHDWGVEKWFDWNNALKFGYGDCKVFTAERCAELWDQGIDARPYLSWGTIADGPHAGVIMNHYRVSRPIASLGVDPPPYLHTPAGPTVEQDPDDPSLVIEDPSRVLGLHWEAAFATTNRYPSSPEFRRQLTRLLGGANPGQVSDLFPAAAGVDYWPWPPYRGARHFGSIAAAGRFAGRVPLHKLLERAF